MKRNPLVILPLCVALFAVLMMSVGRAVYPYVGAYIGEWPFDTIEAMVSATLAFGLCFLLCV